MNSDLKLQGDAIRKIGSGKRILFANAPADGHFNPLTSLAVHLKSLGYDVRWYTSKGYEPKIAKMQIPFYPLVKALDFSSSDPGEIFPDREKHKSQISKLNFDLINVFILRGPEYFEDIKDIYKTFPFDLLIADCTFAGSVFVKEKMNIPVISIGIVPLTEESKDLPPAGLGLTPATNIFGRIKQAGLRWMANNVLFKKSNKVLADVCAAYNIPYSGENVFNFIIRKSTLLLQSATPGFEYYRSDLGKNIRYVGPLLPYTTSKQRPQWFDERLNQYEKVILLTQGTVEKDVEKLLVPTLEAFKDTDVLVVTTTGGSKTAELRERFPEANIIIEDFIPFDDVMPYADVYVTNGGYGGVLLGIENELPLVVAGVHEGKNEICARIGYFKLGINLKTETPKPEQVMHAVTEVLNNINYKVNVKRLAAEFSKYLPAQLTAKYVKEVLDAQETFRVRDQEEAVY